MRRMLLVAVALSALAAAPGPPASPDPKAKVDALFQEFDRSDMPGCALGVFRDGKIVYARGYGMANLELGVANSPQTVFDIGSTAKQFSAFAIQLLARDGKLSLDDDVRKWVPEIPSWGKTVTIRHLLHHTGGMRDYIELMSLQGVMAEDLSPTPTCSTSWRARRPRTSLPARSTCTATRATSCCRSSSSARPGSRAATGRSRA